MAATAAPWIPATSRRAVVRIRTAAPSRTAEGVRQSAQQLQPPRTSRDVPELNVSSCARVCAGIFLSRCKKRRHLLQRPFGTFLGTALHEVVPTQCPVPSASKCRRGWHLGRRTALQRACEGCAGCKRRMFVLLSALAGCISSISAFHGVGAFRTSQHRPLVQQGLAMAYGPAA